MNECDWEWGARGAAGRSTEAAKKFPGDQGSQLSIRSSR